MRQSNDMNIDITLVDRQRWCSGFAEYLLHLRPTLSKREAFPIANRFFESSYGFEPQKAVKMALQSELIRRSDRGLSWDAETNPGIFGRRNADTDAI
jgi:hypothetical protein